MSKILLNKGLVMKKFLKVLMCVCLVVCTCFTLVGCKDVVWSKTTNDTTKVLEGSNGGIVLQYNGYIYFVNGTKEPTNDNVASSHVQSAIYRVKVDDAGEIYHDVEVEGKDGKETKKELNKCERLVSSIAGFESGSIYIFGDYLYYATPCSGRDDSGNYYYQRVEFRRYDLVNKNDQLLYTTKQSDDTISYAYLKKGASLNLAIFEKGPKTLKVLKIDGDVKVNFTKKEVVSAIFSQNYGENQVQDSIADQYIYYTLSYDPETESRGNRVFAITVDGKTELQLTQGNGSSVSLLSVEYGYVIYAADSTVYAQKMIDTTEELSFDDEKIVCTKQYENVIFVEGENNLIALVYENTTLRSIYWDESVNGSTSDKLVSNTIVELPASTKITFIGVDGDYVFYKTSSLIYKIKYKNIQTADDKVQVKLSTTKIDDAKEMMVPEIMDGYIYGFYTDSSAKTTYLYRINILTPMERNELDEDGEPITEVGEAELVGVKE